MGHQINNGEIYIHRKTPIITAEVKEKIKRLDYDEINYEDRPAVLKSHAPFKVDRVILTSNDENGRLVKTIFR